ncbi:mitochondrial nucleoid-associated protein 1 [Anas platyrhynchos]|uniref:mitochondrial nucleoid-associated protein 1 n=1 Tax=Anas platyrhynchos TaxID=8839 RepID=UPI003AF2E63D
MAEGPGGPQRCPYCHRNFRRLRSHLPHCKAAPGRRGEAATGITGPEAELARSLDLRPDEAVAAAAKLRRGPKVAIEKHRAVVLREPPGTGTGARPTPGPGPQRAAGPEAAEPRAPGPGGCSTAEIPPVPGTGRGPSPGGLLPQRGAGHGAPGAASCSDSRRLPAEEPGGDGERTVKKEPSGTDTAGPGGTEPRGSGWSSRAAAVGLEWFPELAPHYRALGVFAERPWRGEVGGPPKAPRGDLAAGRQEPLAERRLLDVRLGELPTWLTTQDFSPRGLLGGVQKAWNGYCNKYINVRKGGAAGVSMLLAGYCILSYGWSYQHIKRNRWRKYH